MSVGFRARTAATGVLQFDERYFGLALVASGSANSVAPPGLMVNSFLSVEVTSAYAPLIAWRCASAAVALMGVSQSGSTWTYTFSCEGAIGTPISYYVFDKPTALGAGVALRIRKADGSITFDSRHKYARIHAVVVEEDYTDLDAETLTYESGRTYAVAQGILAGQFYANAVPGGGSSWIWGWTFDALGAKGETNGVSFAEIRVAQDNGISETPPIVEGSYPETITYAEARYFIIDVTDY